MKNSLSKVASLISNIFNAYLSLIASLGLILYINKDKIADPLFVFIFSVFLLSINLFILKKIGIISDWEMKDRKERPAYGFAAMIPYSFIMYFAFKSTSSQFVSLSLVIFLINLVLTVVSIFWKISGHMLYLTMFVYTLYIVLGNIWVLILSIPILILVGWSRVYLKRHTVLQVVLGTLVSLIICFIIY